MSPSTLPRYGLKQQLDQASGPFAKVLVESSWTAEAGKRKRSSEKTSEAEAKSTPISARPSVGTMVTLRFLSLPLGWCVVCSDGCRKMCAKGRERECVWSNDVLAFAGGSIQIARGMLIEKETK